MMGLNNHDDGNYITHMEKKYGNTIYLANLFIGESLAISGNGEIFAPKSIMEYFFFGTNEKEFKSDPTILIETRKSSKIG